LSQACHSSTSQYDPSPPSEETRLLPSLAKSRPQRGGHLKVPLPSSREWDTGQVQRLLLAVTEEGVHSRLSLGTMTVLKKRPAGSLLFLLRLAGNPPPALP